MLLDFGGTLFSYRGMREGTLELIAEAVRRLDVEADLRKAARAYREGSRRAFEKFVPRRYYLHREVFHEAFRLFAGSLGGAAEPDFLEWFYEAQRRLVVEQFSLRPGCRETLESLRAEGLHLGVVSNIDDDYLMPMLSRSGLAERLDAWTSSEEAGSCKPDAEIFARALSKAGAEPDETIFVGDSREHDIAGARALGMETVLVVEQGATPPGAGAGAAAEPHHEITDLCQLLPIARGSS